jgi:hypothetical protein
VEAKNRCRNDRQRGVPSGAFNVFCSWVISVPAVACSLIGTTAHADALARDDTPSVLVIAAPAKPGSAEADVTEAVRDALAENSEVKLLPPSPLDLDAVQLAIDCTEESAHCMAEIATRMEADIVVIPSLKARTSSLELQLRCFKQGSRVTTAMRKQAGTQLDSTLLDAVPGMLHEVLGLRASQTELAEASEPEPVALSEPEPAGEEAQARAQADDAAGDLPLGPVLLGGGGLALVAAGIVAGVMANASEDEYASRTIDTIEQAKQADAVREQGESEALAANVLLGVGAGALIAAGIWYVLDDGTERPPSLARASLRPVLGPRSAGLLFSGHWQSQP